MEIFYSWTNTTGVILSSIHIIWTANYIYEILQEDGEPFLSGRTTGDDKLIIVGNNFGVANHPTKHPLVTYGVDLVYGMVYTNDTILSNNIFQGLSCSVTTAHTEITCYTSEGAGAAYLLQLILDDQSSIVATTTYAAPVIMSIDGPGSREAIEDGNQVIFIHGKNFGPNKTSSKSFLESVTYGEDGSEYVAPCVLHSHTLIECTTVPGSGVNLIWRVTVFGQTSLITPNGRTSYAAPVISNAYPNTVGTVGFEILQLEGSNFGLTDSSKHPVFTSIEIKYQNNIYEVEIDRTKSDAGIYYSSYRLWFAHSSLSFSNARMYHM